MVNTRSALTRLGTRARGRDGDQRWLPLRLSALHSRGRPDKRNSVPLPGLPKFTGSAFAVLVRMTKEALTIEGTYKTFSSIGGSGNPILRHFCPECGSSIAEEPGTRPGIIILNVGTLDDPTVAKAGREIFRDDAKLYMSCTASRRKPPRSAASHNLLKPYPSPARRSGSRRGKSKAEPLPLPRRQERRAAPTELRGDRGPMVRIHLPPAASQANFRVAPRAPCRIASLRR